MDTLSRGNYFAILICASLLNGGNLLTSLHSERPKLYTILAFLSEKGKGLFCSPRKKFFYIKADPVSERYVIQERKQDVIKVIPLCKNVLELENSTILVLYGHFFQTAAFCVTT